MITVRSIQNDLKRIAILICRRANGSEGLLVWVCSRGQVCCAHKNTQEARTILSDAPALVVGTYGPGVRALDILDDLDERAQEVAPPLDAESTRSRRVAA